MTARYRTIADDLRRRLASQEWPVGTFMPSIGELMNAYGVPSLNTIRGAQRLLVDEGLVAPEPGRGVRVVAHPAPTRPGCDHSAILKAIAEARRLLLEAERALEICPGASR